MVDSASALYFFSTSLTLSEVLTSITRGLSSATISEATVTILPLLGVACISDALRSEADSPFASVEAFTLSLTVQGAYALPFVRQQAQDEVISACAPRIGLEGTGAGALWCARGSLAFLGRFFGIVPTCRLRLRLRGRFRVGPYHLLPQRSEHALLHFLLGCGDPFGHVSLAALFGSAKCLLGGLEALDQTTNLSIALINKPKIVAASGVSFGKFDFLSCERALCILQLALRARQRGLVPPLKFLDLGSILTLHAFETLRHPEKHVRPFAL